MYVFNQEEKTIKNILNGTLKPDYKYRVDFYYWRNGCGFDFHIDPIEFLDDFIEAKDYIKNKIAVFKENPPPDAIMVRVMDNKNGYVLSEYWWDYKEGEEKCKI